MRSRAAGRHRDRLQRSTGAGRFEVGAVDAKLSSRRRPGPILRGGCCLKKVFDACALTERPRRMGPGVRRDDNEFLAGYLLFRLSRFRQSATKATNAASAGG